MIAGKENYNIERNLMNYYNEIKNELTNNEVYKRVKDYSKKKWSYYILQCGKIVIRSR